MDTHGSLIGIARGPRHGAPMELLSEVRVSTRSGVEGENRGRELSQVTILADSPWKAACAEVGKDLPWTTRRANLLLTGVELQNTRGATLKIGEVVLEITDELAPCHVMDILCGGLRKALTPQWRGGVSCRVLAGGILRLGDPVTLVLSSASSAPV